jgi:hypothetical protein
VIFEVRVAKRNKDRNYTFARGEDFKGSIFRTSVKQSNESSKEEPRIRNYIGTKGLQPVNLPK